MRHLPINRCLRDADIYFIHRTFWTQVTEIESCEMSSTKPSAFQAIPRVNSSWSFCGLFIRPCRSECLSLSFVLVFTTIDVLYFHRFLWRWKTNVQNKNKLYLLVQTLQSQRYMFLCFIKLLLIFLFSYYYVKPLRKIICRRQPTIFLSVFVGVSRH